ncbi:uncharacterized protein [Epargyreus clarus]|uniref:uncharacterized protein n=1 Tax=Epargyreus clarus TaxID=520877 RepID=UPI003C305BF9
MFRFVVLLCAVSLVLGQTTQVSQCTNHGGELPMNTYIEGCAVPPCLLPQLEDAVISMIFRAPRLLRSMRTLATAYLNMGLITVPIPYNLGENAITCNFLTNTYCPVLAGEVVQYTLRMFIESTFPVGTAANIEFRVVDESNLPLLCIHLAIRVEPPLRNRSISNSTLAIEDLRS